MADLNLYYLAAFYLIYAFLGWVLEVSFHVVTVGKFINRGFLNGPICPIYGAGMVTVIVLLSPFKDNLLVLFIVGLLFATLIELIGGFVLYKLFSMRWWDYSKEPFNLGGFICPRFSLAWGICIVFVMKVIHPIIAVNVRMLDRPIGYVLIYGLLVVFFADFIVTVLTVAKLNKDIKYIDKVAGEIRKVSDGLTDKIGNTTVKATTKVQAGQVQAALARLELKDEFDDIVKRSKGLFGYNRLLKAFPEMKSTLTNVDVRGALESVKEITLKRKEQIQKGIDELSDEIGENIKNVTSKIGIK